MFFFIFLVFAKKEHLLIMSVGLGIMFGLVWSGWNVSNIVQKEQIIENFDGEKVLIVAKVDNLYKKSDQYNSYILHTISIDTVPIPDIYGLVYYPKNLSLKKGDVVHFETRLQKIDNFSEGFSYIRFAQTKNIYFSIFPNIGTVQNHIPPPKFIQTIDTLRANMLEKIFDLYPKNEAVFL